MPRNGTLPAMWGARAGVSPAELGRTYVMDKDRIEGTVKEGAGKVQEEWGRATDNPQTEAEGDERQIESLARLGDCTRCSDALCGASPHHSAWPFSTHRNQRGACLRMSGRAFDSEAGGFLT